MRTTRLPNGIRVVTEDVPSAHSVATGFWVGVGARDEGHELAGTSHFLEHLLFKGTEARTAASIAEAVDAVGGEMNAYTTHEYTAYYTRLPAGQLTLGLDLLSDVLWAPAFRPREVEAERQVILEELLAEEDCPDDRVHTLLAEAMFPEHPLGVEVLGTEASIRSLGREQIRGFHATWYRPANLVVAAAGRLDHDRVVDGVERRFAGGEGGEAPSRRPPTDVARRLAVLTRPTEQAYVAVGVPGLDRHDDDRFALVVANQVLGGGMSSRLFQTIREERGLAYSVGSSVSSYSDAGTLVASAGTTPARVPEVLGLVHAELDRIVDGGVTEHELGVAKGYVEGSTLLSLEDPGSRMGRLGDAMLTHGEVKEVDEVLERFRAVDRADVARVLGRVLGGAPRTVAVVGPVPRSRLEELVA
ncbi:MAG: insulinase family protein [Actinobacteria bacterium]|nr:insulinase family protein [Actinomycetota bacterium]